MSQSVYKFPHTPPLVVEDNTTLGTAIPSGEDCNKFMLPALWCYNSAGVAVTVLLSAVEKA